MNTAKPIKLRKIIDDMIRSACPEVPVDIHLQNDQLKLVMRQIQERNPRVLNRAIHQVFNGV